MAKAPALELDDLEAGKLEALLERIQPLIQPEDFRVLQCVIATLHLLLELIQKARLSLRRLRQMIFGPKTEKSHQVLAKSKDQAASQTGQLASPGHRICPKKREKAMVATEWRIIQAPSGSSSRTPPCKPAAPVRSAN